MTGHVLVARILPFLWSADAYCDYTFLGSRIGFTERNACARASRLIERYKRDRLGA